MPVALIGGTYEYLAGSFADGPFGARICHPCGGDEAKVSNHHLGSRGVRRCRAVSDCRHGRTDAATPGALGGGARQLRVVPRRIDRQRGAALDRGGPRRLDRDPAVGHRRLPADPRIVHPPRRIAVRRVRPHPDPPPRARDLRHRLGRLRSRSHGDRAHRRRAPCRGPERRCWCRARSRSSRPPSTARPARGRSAPGRPGPAWPSWSARPSADCSSTPSAGARSSCSTCCPSP